jgi:hypothetical protein
MSRIPDELVNRAGTEERFKKVSHYRSWRCGEAQGRPREIDGAAAAPGDLFRIMPRGAGGCRRGVEASATSSSDIRRLRGSGAAALPRLRGRAPHARRRIWRRCYSTKRVTLPGRSTHRAAGRRRPVRASKARARGDGGGAGVHRRDPRARARAVQARGRRHPARAPDHARRGGARRQGRGGDRRRTRAAHDPQGHELGPRVPPQGQGRQKRGQVRARRSARHCAHRAARRDRRQPRLFLLRVAPEKPLRPGRK